MDATGTTDATGGHVGPSGAAAGRDGSPARRDRSDRARTVFAAFFLVFLGFPLAQAWGMGGPRGGAGSALIVLFALWYALGLLAGEQHPPRLLRRLREWQWLVGLVVLAALVIAVLGVGGLWLSFYIASGVAGTHPTPRGFAAILVIGAAVAALGSAYSVEWWWGPLLGAWCIAIGLSVWVSTRHDFVQAALVAEREEKAALAVDLERGRLARDLHDILGHSLTVVTVKAQLAARLVDADPERAKSELGDIERLARDALLDVRSTVTSYRSLSLTGEIVGAGRALAAAQITGDLPGAVDDVPTHLRDVTAWAVREGVTNIVRHSGARHAWVTLSPAGVEVGDDGCGIAAEAPPGNGLIGLAERARQAGAVMTVQPGPHGRGTVLRVVVDDSPAPPPQRARMDT